MVFVWVILYGLTSLLPDLPAGILPGGLRLNDVLTIVYVALFVLWIFRTGRQKSAGLEARRHPVPVKVWLLLAVLPLSNLLSGGLQGFQAQLLLTACTAAVTEEIFFRGFLLTYLRRRGPVSATVLTSLAFSVMHSVNFLTDTEPGYVWLQILSSFFVSICYCSVAIRFDSIYLCIASHFLTNVTGNGLLERNWKILFLLGSVVIYALWGLQWLVSIKNNKKETVI